MRSITDTSLTSLKGRLVVAVPTLADPNFNGTVVLMLEHGDAGGLGVVLNRPSSVGIGDLLPREGTVGWADLAAAPAVVFEGGPVEEHGLLGVIRVRPGAPPVGWQPIAEPFGVVDLAQDPAEVGAAVGALRVFAGHAGWAPGQLEAEVAAGGWFVVDADEDDVFSARPEALWRRVLRRQGGFLATVPPDPTTN